MLAKTLNRRAALGLYGGALTLALAGGALWVVEAAGRSLAEGDAYAPWRLWDDPGARGTPLALVAAGALAANPHNTQPWLFRVGETQIDVLADLSRHLGAVDAFVRELHLGLGCAIENMALAAAPNGLDVAVEIVDGSLLALAERARPVAAARLHLTRRPLSAADALYRAIPVRHTNRYPYDRGRPVPADWLAFAHGAAEDGARVVLFDDGAARRAFDAAVVEATEAIIADAEMIGDSDRWFRNSPAAVEAHRDGPTLEAAGLSHLTLAYDRLFPVSPQASRAAWLGQVRNSQLPSAPLTGLIAVSDRYDRRGAIAAGRLWQRLHLAATAAGAAMQPLNQPIEMIDRERSTARGDAWARRIAALAGADGQATFAFRVGMPTSAAPPSPRRRLADVVAT